MTLGRQTDTPVTFSDVNRAHVSWSWDGNAARPLYAALKQLYLDKRGGDRNFNRPSNVVLTGHDLDRIIEAFPHMQEDVECMRGVLRDGAVLVALPAY